MLRTHVHSCTSAACGGCEPCRENHCQAWLSLHPEHGSRVTCNAHIPGRTIACGLCRARAEHAVTTITELAALCLPAAVMAGTVTNEAAVLAGPAPDPYTRTRRNLDLREADRRDWIEDDDPHHPFAVLGRWAMMTAESLGLPPLEVHTVSGYASHLLGHLDEITAHETHGFPDMLAELRACRQHLEGVLHNSHLPETGVPCPACSTPDRAGPRLEHILAADPTGAGDGWRCPRCRAWWTEAAYRLRVGREAREHATRLTAAAITELYRVPAGTLRRWAHEGRVTRYGRDASGKQLYSVPDVLRCREDTRAAAAGDAG